MLEHPIADLLEISMDRIKEMIDVNTIIGNTIKINNDISLIPVSKVKCTFVTGGTEMSKGRVKEEDGYPFGGATGGSVTIEPIAFVASTKDDVKVLHFNDKTYLTEALIDKVPELISKAKEMLCNKKGPKITNLEVVEKK